MKARHQLLIRYLWLILFLIVGCSQEIDLDGPPEIIYGQDICDECGMIINEQRFAASYTTDSGEVRRFDDIGGMLLHNHETNEIVHIYWVHDFKTEEWIDASQAMFVVNRGLTTPMGWGVAAFAHMNDAEAYVAEHGGAMASFTELQEEIKMGTLDPEAFFDGQQEHDHNMTGDE